MGFSQTGSIWLNFVTLQDTGSDPLFNGSKIFCFCDDMLYGGNIHQGNKALMMPSTPDFVNDNAGSVWQDLITNMSFSGIDNPKMTLKGRWTTDLGSYSTDGVTPILTPYKINVLASSGRTFYLKDERIIEQMILESGSQFYGGDGVPVVITDFSMSAVSKGDKNSVSWSVSLREDKV